MENTYNAKDLEERDERAYKILVKNNSIKDSDKDNFVHGIGIILQTKEGKYIFQKRDNNTHISP
ncbi:MAG: hypothetical protein WCP92_00975 [bacterium]